MYCIKYQHRVQKQLKTYFLIINITFLQWNAKKKIVLDACQNLIKNILNLLLFNIKSFES